MSSTFKTPKGSILPVLNLRGKDYLEVKYRIVWFREERPLQTLETEYVKVTDISALAKATIRDEQGRILATAHKYEDKQGFTDFLEKAETGAIGRALALIGYGTQFCADELEEGNRLADSPVTRMRVTPSQPEAGDGYPQVGGEPYRIPFGKYAKRGLEDIDLNDLRSYVLYLESESVKKNKPITGQVLEFVERAEAHIAALENA